MSAKAGTADIPAPQTTTTVASVSEPDSACRPLVGTPRGRLSLGRLAAVRDRRPEAWSGRPSELWPEVGGLNEIVSRPLKSSRMSIAKTEAPSFAKLRALSADFQLRLRTTLTLDFGPATRDPLIKLP